MASVLTEPVSTASAKHIRFSAYKVREVLDLIRGQQAELALGILDNTNRGSAKTVMKILSSAIANATHAQGYEAMELFVLECFADEGMTIKRFRPRARGRASRIRKRTCHLTITLGRLSDEELTKLREKRNAELTAKRQRRVKAAQEKSSKDIASETDVQDEDIVSDELSENSGVEESETLIADENSIEDTSEIDTQVNSQNAGDITGDINGETEGSDEAISQDETTVVDTDVVGTENEDAADIKDQGDIKDKGETVESNTDGEDK